jgi:hypothetical protein
MLRVANAVPAMKRRMARSETELRDRRQHPALAAIGAGRQTVAETSRS